MAALSDKARDNYLLGGDNDKEYILINSISSSFEESSEQLQTMKIKRNL